MGVSFNGNCRYNPTWIDTLTDSQIKGVLCHEVMHVALTHLLRLGKRKFMIWNVACDMMINYMIMLERYDLPKEGIIPDHGTIYKLPYKKGFIEIDIKDKCAEEVYEMIDKECDGDDDSDGNDGYGGQPGPDGGGSDSNGNNNDPNGWNGFDSHEYGDNLSDEEVRQIEKEWKGKIADAAIAAREKYKGSLPGYLQRMIDELLHPVLPWKPMLYQYITKCIPFNSTYRRPGRRSYTTGIYMPIEIKENLEVLVTVDCSGSISDKEYKEFITEVHGIASAFEQINMRLLHWDTRVTKDITITRSNKRELLNSEITGGGGTYLSCVTEYLQSDEGRKAQKTHPVVSVHLTDGWIEENPVLPMGMHLFVLTPGGTDEYIKNVPSSRIANLI